MKTDEVKLALERLLSYTPYRCRNLDPSGLVYEEVGEPATRLVALAAQFVQGLKASGVADELQRRAKRWEENTGPGSPADLARAAARRLGPTEALTAAGTRQGRRLIRRPYAPAQGDGQAVDIRHYFDSGKTLVEFRWNPLSLRRSAQLALADPHMVGKAELRCFVDELTKLESESGTKHLWGCFLLMQAAKAVEIAGRAFDGLVAQFTSYPDEAIATLKDAAVYLYSLATGTTNDPAVISSVTIVVGEQRWALDAEGKLRHSMADDESKIFTLFAGKVFAGAPSEIVDLSLLNRVVGKDNEAERSCDSLRQILHRMRENLAVWGTPPDNDDWIVTKRKKGLHLNTSVHWKLSDAARRVLNPPSVRLCSTDPVKMAKNTDARGNELRPLRKTRPRSSDMDGDHG